MSEDIPTNRLEWSTLEWSETQLKIALLLSKNNFMKFVEKRLSKSNRADILVYRNLENEIIFGVIEVKTYKKLTKSIENQAQDQIIRYLSELYYLVNSNKRWGNKKRRYFGCVVFSNDYPIMSSIGIHGQSQYSLPEEMIKNHDIEIFYCTPEKLISSLQDKNLSGFIQGSLDKYY